MAKTEVAEAKNNLPAGMFDEYEGAGLENVTKDDVLIPRLNILQALSPQLNKKKPEFIEGASIGDICDVGTGDVFEAPIDFLPVKFEKVYIEWAPRESGKGLVAIHSDSTILNSCTQNDKGQWLTEEGNSIQETSQFYGLNLSAGGRKCFISFASTQLKKARKLNSLAMSEKAQRADGSKFTPPLFYRVYKIGSAEESNASGEWSGWTINRGQKLEEMEGAADHFAEAKNFYEQLATGAVKADHSDMEGESSEGEAAM